MKLRRGLKGMARSTRLRVWRGQRRAGQLRRRVLPNSIGPSEVADRFDYWAYRDELQDAVSAALADATVEHLVIRNRSLAHPLVVIGRDDAEPARAALARHPRTARCYGAQFVHSIGAPAAPVSWRQPLLPQTTGLLLTRNLVTADGVELIHPDWGVLLDYWDPGDQTPYPPLGSPPSADALVARTPNGVVGHISAAVWREVQQSGHRLPERPPPLLQVNEPVDVVYTWVDGHDPAWQARKAQYLGVGLSEIAHSADSAIPARYENREELRYSLRSVQAFASWVRQVWVVTDRQVPDWLRTDHPRLTVVDHRDIFSDPDALPSFNSHAIESQLHHIPGLANLYIYLNDDVLFGSPVRPENFFHGNGLVKFFPSPAPVEPRDPSPFDVAVTAAGKNNRAFLEQATGRTLTNKLRHTAQPQSVSVLRKLEAEHPELLDSVMRARFRRRSDYSIASSLGQYYAFTKGLAVPGRIRNGYVDVAHPLAGHVLERWLRGRAYNTLCINDSGASDETLTGLLKAFFEEYFPLASDWERS